jgi:hypothetical protein
MIFDHDATPSNAIALTSDILATIIATGREHEAGG